jgi:predicted deacylase
MEQLGTAVDRHGNTEVTKGQALVVVNARKMVRWLRAPHAGSAEFSVDMGDLVIVDQVAAHKRSMEFVRSEQTGKPSSPTQSDQSSSMTAHDEVTSDV